MDLNYLLHRQQVERARAEAASSEAARTAHQQLAQQYEGQIEALTGTMFTIAANEEPARDRPANP